MNQTIPLHWLNRHKKEKKHPGICLVFCQCFFCFHSSLIQCICPFWSLFCFFIYKAYTRSPMATANHQEPGFRSSLFIRLVICHKGALSMKNSLNSMQSGAMEILYLQPNSIFYLNAPSIWASQISIHQCRMAKWCDTNNKDINCSKNNKR